MMCNVSHLIFGVTGHPAQLPELHLYCRHFRHTAIRAPTRRATDSRLEIYVRIRNPGRTRKAPKKSLAEIGGLLLEHVVPGQMVGADQAAEHSNRHFE